jgi:Tn3 transposase DDE domain
MIGKLHNMQRQNPIQQAMQEVGRIYKARHILLFIDDETFRRQVLMVSTRVNGRMGRECDHSPQHRRYDEGPYHIERTGICGGARNRGTIKSVPHAELATIRRISSGYGANAAPSRNTCRSICPIRCCDSRKHQTLCTVSYFGKYSGYTCCSPDGCALPEFHPLGLWPLAIASSWATDLLICLSIKVGAKRLITFKMLLVPGRIS